MDSSQFFRGLDLADPALALGEKVIIFSTSLKAIDMLQELIPQHFQKRAAVEGGLRCQEHFRWSTGQLCTWCRKMCGMVYSKNKCSREKII